MADIPVIYYNQTPDISERINPQWWLEDEDEMYAHLLSGLRVIEKRQTDINRKNVINRRLYGNDPFTLYAQNIYARNKATTQKQSKLRLNVCKAAIDTVTSKIAKNRARPLFLTEKGNHPQQFRAKKLTQYVEGEFKRLEVYNLCQLSFRDAGIWGTGLIKVYPDHGLGKMAAERVLIDEVIVDEVEGLYGQPRTIYQRRYIHREILKNFVRGEKDEKAKIELINMDTVQDIDMNRPIDIDKTHMLYTVEAWHLPSYPGAGDGRHCIVIPTGTLVSEEYKKDFFPIIPFYWTPPVIGFYGAGIIDEISGLQLEVNYLLQFLQEAQHLMCAPSIWLESGSHFQQQYNNKVGNIYRYSGAQPLFYTPSAMSSEVYQHVWNIYKRAFEIVGVSELSATLKKPAGIESKPALREYSDIETERFAIVAQRYEAFIMEIARRIVDGSKELYEGGAKDLSVNAKGKRFIETIKWKDVDMEDDQYVMDVYPTSLLPQTPAGKREAVQELLEAGLLQREYALELLDFPDVEAFFSLETASLELTREILDNIIENGKYSAPEPFINLEQALSEAQKYYNRAKLDGVEDDKLELLIRWMDQVLVLKQGANPIPPAPAQTQTGLPGVAAPGPQGPIGPGPVPNPTELNGAGVGMAPPSPSIPGPPQPLQ